MVRFARSYLVRRLQSQQMESVSNLAKTMSYVSLEVIEFNGEATGS